MRRDYRRAVILSAVLAGVSALAQSGQAQTEPPETLGSLRGVPTPRPPADEYNRYVKDVGALRVLGKALFWDSAIGSDGVACASCHFNAGADPRIKNQLSPGLQAKPTADIQFGETEFNTINLRSNLTGSGTVAGPNITLKPDDYPFHRLQDPTDRRSAIRYSTNDVTSSQGTFEGAFLSLRTVRTRAGRRDFCMRRDPANPDFGVPFRISVGGRNKLVRKVEPRNTPTAINAAFFFRNFWDGRANNIFNGIDPLGRRTSNDVNARIAVRESSSSLPAAEKVDLENMSLASQAVGPPLSSFEMSCANRTFPDIGRKILSRVPLAGQQVAAGDSLLAGRIRPSGKGLKGTYSALVQAAFQDRLWNGTDTFKIENGNVNPVPITDGGHTLGELNFSLFFGLAIDAYERLLISDQTRFDDHEEGDGNALTATEKQGLELFRGKGKCIACHVGPLLSGAAVPPRERRELIENMIIGDGGTALYDGGFYNIGVRPAFEDPGVGADINGPLSFTRQFVNNNEIDPFPPPEGGRLDRIAVDGAFKTPSLRNVGLTAPYFHNGGEARLRDVVMFYNRGGNRRDLDNGDTTGSGPNGQGPLQPGAGGSNLDADIQSLGLGDDEIDAIVAFLLTLTDQRVACHKAPFDHPELIISDGNRPVAAGARTQDIRKRVPAVGRNGYNQCDKNSGDMFDRNLRAIVRPAP